MGRLTHSVKGERGSEKLGGTVTAQGCIWSCVPSGSKVVGTASGTWAGVRRDIGLGGYPAISPGKGAASGQLQNRVRHRWTARILRQAKRQRKRDTPTFNEAAYAVLEVESGPAGAARSTHPTGYKC